MGSDPKYRLSQAQLRALTVDQRPGFDAKGRTILVPNPDRKPYRFADGNQGAPGGFTIYVGPQGARYEVRTRIKRSDGAPAKAVRITLGAATDITIVRAYELAGTKRIYVRETQADPRAALKAEAAAQEARGTTVGDAMRDYIAYLQRRQTDGTAKANGVAGARDALARLERPDVGLAGAAIADLTDARIREAWAALRQSAMIRSNRIAAPLRERLAQYDRKDARAWQALTMAELIARLGMSGKDAARVFAAGKAAAEHTMGDAARAVSRVIESERKAAANAGRPVALAHNPLDVLRSDGYYRSTRQLRQHYDAARVRNPLGVDDSEAGTKSLPSVLKAIVGRRDMQGGHNAAAVDYLLLMLLWGTRRSEIAAVRWFDGCTKDEADPRLRLASWVWLAPTPDAKNPATRLAGSQVYIHDTKSGDDVLMPIAYFAARVLHWRAVARLADTERLSASVAAADATLASARVGSAKRIAAIAEKERAAWRLEQVRRWVFPARNPKAKEGHYTDSKSIISNVRADTGLDVLDVGLTPHDFRRTMGRVAARVLPGYLVSRLLHHTAPSDQAMAPVSERYTAPEWSELRKAMAQVDEAMIRTSPRVWNILREAGDAAYPAMDEAHDPEVIVPAWRGRGRGHGNKTNQG